MDKILIGRKGKDIESGYVWVPYIILESKTVVMDSNFSPKMSLRSRYGVTETKPQKRSRKIKSILERIKA
jgi:hypothetical protein